MYLYTSMRVNAILIALEIASVLIMYKKTVLLRRKMNTQFFTNFTFSPFSTFTIISYYLKLFWLWAKIIIIYAKGIVFSCMLYLLCDLEHRKCYDNNDYLDKKMFFCLLIYNIVFILLSYIFNSPFWIGSNIFFLH